MLLGYLNTIYLMPASFREFKDLQREFRSELSSLFLQEGVFNPVVEGITVFIRERSESGQLFGIIIHDERVPEEPVTMMAEQGAIVTSDKGPRVLMVNGNRQEVRADDGRLSLLYFDRYTFDLSALNKTEIDLWREPRERFLNELFFPADQAQKIYNYRELRMEGLFRLSSPLLYLAFTAIGLGAVAQWRLQSPRAISQNSDSCMLRHRRPGHCPQHQEPGRKDPGAGIHHVSGAADRYCRIPDNLLCPANPGRSAGKLAGRICPKRIRDVTLSRTFSSYVGRQFLFSFLAFTIGLLAIIMLFDTLELFRRVSARAEVAGTSTVITMALLKLPTMAEKLIPFSALLGAMFAFWRLNRYNEFVVARAAGVSIWQFLAPPCHDCDPDRAFQDRDLQSFLIRHAAQI